MLGVYSLCFSVFEVYFAIDFGDTSLSRQMKWIRGLVRAVYEMGLS